MSALFSFWTVLVGVVFVGITVWAYGSGRRCDFEDAARIPLEDERGDETATRTTEDG